jgi:DNA polymerase elongation subunit (family B)
MTKDESSLGLIFGANASAGLVAAEHLPGKKGQDEILLFVRKGTETEQTREPFSPFLWLEDKRLLGDAEGCDVQTLSGRNPLKILARFQSWKEFQKFVSKLKAATGRNPSDPSAPFFLLNDPIQQHLLATGRTFFKEMKFGDLKRMQVDIETYTAGDYEFSNPAREGDRIIAIALADQSGWNEVLSGTELDEKAMIQRFVEIVRERDPDVLEGHNLFKFDLPYIAARARLHKVKLALGRDGSVPDSRPSRFNIAERTISYPRTEIFGRHVVDTFFLAQIYDVSQRSLEGFGLKDVALHFGVAAPDRTYLEGDEIARTFDKDPKKVMRYARDDILETKSVSDLLSPTYFVQAQMLPFSYQNVCVRGNGAKIDALLLREYLREDRSIAQPDFAREFEGGYTDIFFTGVAKNVHHCDVRSLYPSIILKDKLSPRTDDLGIFLKLLTYLRTLRLDTKARMQKSQSGEERHFLNAMQSTFKILINSFYGYLGFGQARFSDFAMAEKVTAEGRSILKQMIEWLRKHDARPIEIDTDGIYFIPPEFPKPAGLEHFRETFQESLPEGIDVEFDGEYRAMFSYKMKNYALLDDHGEIVIKGAALKSRGLEPFQRSFMEEWLRLKLEERDKEIPKLVQRYRSAIENREWPIQRLAKTETLQDAPATYAGKISEGDRGRNAAYELALKSGRDYRAGDLVSYYVTGNKKSVAVHSSAKLVSEWDPNNRDENTTYYLAKLDALIGKFDSMAAADADRNLTLDFGGEKNGEP